MKDLPLSRWSVDDCILWLQEQARDDQTNLEEAIEAFRKNQIKGCDLLVLERQDLQDELRIATFGVRRILWLALTKLRNQSGESVLFEVKKTELKDDDDVNIERDMHLDMDLGHYENNEDAVHVNEPESVQVPEQRVARKRASGKRSEKNLDIIKPTESMLKSVFGTRVLPDDLWTSRPRLPDELPHLNSDGEPTTHFTGQYSWSGVYQNQDRQHRKRFVHRLIRSSLLHNPLAVTGGWHWAVTEEHVYFIWCPHPETSSPIPLHIFVFNRKSKMIVQYLDSTGDILNRLQQDNPQIKDPYARFPDKVEPSQNMQSRFLKYLIHVNEDFDEDDGDTVPEFDDIASDDTDDEMLGQSQKKHPKTTPTIDSFFKPIAKTLVSMDDLKSDDTPIKKPIVFLEDNNHETPIQKSTMNQASADEKSIETPTSSSRKRLMQSSLTIESFFKPVPKDATPCGSKTAESIAEDNDIPEMDAMQTDFMDYEHNSTADVMEYSSHEDTKANKSQPDSATENKPVKLIKRPTAVKTIRELTFSPESSPAAAPTAVKTIRDLTFSPVSSPELHSRDDFFSKPITKNSETKKSNYDYAAQLSLLEDEDEISPSSDTASDLTLTDDEAVENTPKTQSSIVEKQGVKRDLSSSPSPSPSEYPVKRISLGKRDVPRRNDAHRLITLSDTPVQNNNNKGNRLLALDDTPVHNNTKVHRLLTLGRKASHDSTVSERTEPPRAESSMGPLARLRYSGPKTASFPIKSDKKVLVNQPPQSNLKPIYFPPFLVETLRPHQIDGVRFMWNVIMKEVKKESERHGCVLAHSMGLGKTLQVITFIHCCMIARNEKHPHLPALFYEHPVTPYMETPQNPALRVLILGPTTVLENWQNEFEQWIPHSHYWYYGGGIYRIVAQNSWSQRKRIISDWYRKGGVLIMGYERYQSCLGNRKSTEKELDVDDYVTFLQSPGPHIVVCDEAHRIKNPKSQISQVVKLISSPVRICLTGSPLQNNLEEYWCMADFVNPNFLGDLNDFRYRYSTPIVAGLAADCTAMEKRQSIKKLFVLQKILDPFVFRLDLDQDRQEQRVTRSKPQYGSLAPSEKREFTIKCNLTKFQIELYMNILHLHGFIDHRAPGEAANRVIERLHELLLVVNHPATLLSRIEHYKQSGSVSAPENSTAKTQKTKTGGGSSADPIVLDDDEDGVSDDDLNESLDEEEPILPISLGGITQNPKALEDDEELIDYATSIKDLLSSQLQTPEEKSFKVTVLMEIIRHSKRLNDKVLVFSRSIPTLDFLEAVLTANTITYRRLCGNTPASERQHVIDDFNTDPSIDVFLISINVGCLGVNCQSANRVVLFDAGWNPSNDEQAIARAHRFGQSKTVYVYRLYAYGTIEDTLYKLNLKKLTLSKMVVDRKHTSAVFTKNELTQYFAPPILGESHLNPGFDYGDEVVNGLRDSMAGKVIEILDHCVLLEHFDQVLSEQEMAEASVNLAEELKRVQKNKEVPVPGTPQGHPPTQSEAITEEPMAPEQRQPSFDSNSDFESPRVKSLHHYSSSSKKHTPKE